MFTSNMPACVNPFEKKLNSTIHNVAMPVAISNSLPAQLAWNQNAANINFDKTYVKIKTHDKVPAFTELQLLPPGISEGSDPFLLRA